MPEKKQSTEPVGGSNGSDNHDLPFATELWEACDRLRGSVESAEYKHLVLGLVFLKYISDSFERRRAVLEAETRDKSSDLYTDDDEERAEVLEDRDEYISENVFWLRSCAGLRPPYRKCAPDMPVRTPARIHTPRRP
jgi:hypothetical protein